MERFFYFFICSRNIYNKKTRPNNFQRIFKIYKVRICDALRKQMLILVIPKVNEFIHIFIKSKYKFLTILCHSTLNYYVVWGSWTWVGVYLKRSQKSWTWHLKSGPILPTRYLEKTWKQRKVWEKIWVENKDDTFSFLTQLM